MKKTILPKKNLAPKGHPQARAQRDMFKGHAKATVMGTKAPKMGTASAFAKGKGLPSKGKSFKAC